MKPRTVGACLPAIPLRSGNREAFAVATKRSRVPLPIACKQAPALGLLLLAALPLRAADAKLAAEFANDIRPLLVEYCSDCHKAGKEVPFLAAQTLADIQSQRGRWRSVAAQLRNHTMPPLDEEQPALADRARAAAWVKNALRVTARDLPDYAGHISVLDLVREDAASLKRKISGADNAKLSEYLDSVRSVEKRLEAAMKPQKRWINEGKFDFPRPGPGIPQLHVDHVRLMLDILTLAFWTDTTRIATFMFGDAQSGRNFDFLGFRGSWHGLSHHLDEEKTRTQYEAISTWHVGEFARFVERLRGLDEGGTSLLDNSMLLFGSTLKDGNKHDHKNLPLVLAGRGQGALRPGRRLTAPVETPLCNLYLALLHRNGIMLPSFGDSTGPLEGLA